MRSTELGALKAAVETTFRTDAHGKHGPNYRVHQKHLTVFEI
jgi:hypothetical protein